MFLVPCNREPHLYWTLFFFFSVTVTYLLITNILLTCWLHDIDGYDLPSMVSKCLLWCLWHFYISHFLKYLISPHFLIVLGDGMWSSSWRVIFCAINFGIWLSLFFFFVVLYLSLASYFYALYEMMYVRMASI